MDAQPVQQHTLVGTPSSTLLPKIDEQVPHQIPLWVATHRPPCQHVCHTIQP